MDKTTRDYFNADRNISVNQWFSTRGSFVPFLSLHSGTFHNA